MWKSHQPINLERSKSSSLIGFWLDLHFLLKIWRKISKKFRKNFQFFSNKATKDYLMHDNQWALSPYLECQALHSLWLLLWLSSKQLLSLFRHCGPSRLDFLDGFSFKCSFSKMKYQWFVIIVPLADAVAVTSAKWIGCCRCCCCFKNQNWWCRLWGYCCHRRPSTPLAVVMVWSCL